MNCYTARNFVNLLIKIEKKGLLRVLKIECNPRIYFLRKLKVVKLKEL